MISTADLGTVSSTSPLSSDRTKLRPRTTYHLAHPPTRRAPASLSRSAKLVLQLQQVSSSGRTLPAYDVVPISALSSRLARVLKMKGKIGLDPDDLAVLRAEDYEDIQDGCATPEASQRSRADSWPTREIYGLVYKIDPAGASQLELYDGSIWHCRRTTGDSYDLTQVTPEAIPTHFAVQGGQWRPRSTRPSMNAGDYSKPCKRRLNFCPKSEVQQKDWQPFAGFLTRERISICDDYFVRRPLSGERAQSLTSASHDMGQAVASNSDAPSPATKIDSSQARRYKLKTTDQLRALIIVSGTWVALWEGWVRSLPVPNTSAALRSPNHRSASKDPQLSVRNNSIISNLSPNRGGYHSRSISLEVGQRRASDFAATSIAIIPQGTSVNGMPDAITAAIGDAPSSGTSPSIANRTAAQEPFAESGETPSPDRTAAPACKDPVKARSPRLKSRFTARGHDGVADPQAGTHRPNKSARMRHMGRCVMRCPEMVKTILMRPIKSLVRRCRAWKSPRKQSGLPAT